MGRAGLGGWRWWPRSPGSSPSSSGARLPRWSARGREERARDALRDDAQVRLLQVDADFPRPRDGADHPLAVRVAVEPRGGTAAGAAKEHAARRVGQAVARRLPEARPLVDVTVLEPPPGEAGGGS